MGHPQGRWSVLLMIQHGGIPAQFQGDCEGQRSLTTKLGGMWMNPVVGLRLTHLKLQRVHRLQGIGLLIDQNKQEFIFKAL
jgi:hypothetical protein